MNQCYRYYAIVNAHYTVDKPLVVIREWDRPGGTSEEMFSTRLEWIRSTILFRINSGRDYDEAVPISEEAAKRFEQFQAERVEAERVRQENLTKD